MAYQESLPVNMTRNSYYMVETDIDRAINSSSNIPNTVYVLQNEAEAQYETPNEDEYHNFNSVNNIAFTSTLSALSETNITRRDMCNYLLKFFPDYEGDNSMVNIIKFLSNRMKCDCTDCGGSDSIGDCEIETEYIKHFGAIAHHNIV